MVLWVRIGCEIWMSEVHDKDGKTANVVSAISNVFLYLYFVGDERIFSGIFKSAGLNRWYNDGVIFDRSPKEESGEGNQEQYANVIAVMSASVPYRKECTN